MDDTKNKPSKASASYNSKGQFLGYSTAERKATDVVSDEELDEKVKEQAAAKEAEKKAPPKQGLGALAAALKKATPTPTPKK